MLNQIDDIHVSDGRLTEPHFFIGDWHPRRYHIDDGYNNIIRGINIRGINIRRINIRGINYGSQSSPYASWRLTFPFNDQRSPSTERRPAATYYFTEFNICCCLILGESIAFELNFENWISGESGLTFELVAGLVAVAFNLCDEVRTDSEISFNGTLLPLLLLLLLPAEFFKIQQAKPVEKNPTAPINEIKSPNPYHFFFAYYYNIYCTITIFGGFLKQIRKEAKSEYDWKKY